MPAQRAYWSGQIRLSLVSIPVELFTATKSTAKISFNQIHEPSGKRVRYEKVVPGIGPVDKDEILKGFEYEKGSYVLLSDEEIEDVRLESRKTLELTQFVDACEIDPIYYDRPYFVAPQDDLAEDAFRVLRDALRETNKVALGQLALRGREYIGAIKPCGNGLLLETLRFEEEIRKTDAYFRSISGDKADGETLDLAKQLIEKKAAPFDASAFKDRYTDALRELIDAKIKSRGGKVEIEDTDDRPQGENVIDLMSALKKSLEGREKASNSSGGSSRSAKRSSTSSRKKPSGSKASGSKAKSTARGSRTRKSA